MSGGVEDRAGQASFTRIDPSRTMLRLEELNGMHDLSGSNLYSAELKKLPLLSREEQQPLIAKARRGDQTARDTLVIHCLHWTMNRAALLWKERQPKHLGLMDLVGVANVEIMEKFDRALEKDDPVVFLLSSAAYEMQSHVSNRDPLITRPRYDREKLKRLDPVPSTTVSLDAPAHEGKHPINETLAAVNPQPLDDVERREERKYAILHQAVHQLSPTLRRATVELYGLFGQPAKTKRELAAEAKITPKGIGDANLRARRLLAERLAPYRTQLMRRSYG